MTKEEKQSIMEETNREASNGSHADGNTGGDVEEGHEETGAEGPDGEFVKFPDYDGQEPPRDCKKAFTHFCNGTRKSVKKALDSSLRKDKVRPDVAAFLQNW
jgi:hypothetical protein